MNGTSLAGRSAAQRAARAASVKTMDDLILAKLNDDPEIFHSLQGEGLSAGVPSVFVRTSGCNLQCTWCDTDYTWNWIGTPYRHDKDTADRPSKHDRQQVQIRMTAREVADRVSAFACANVIFTGGEPLLQSSGLAEVARLLRERQSDCEFEVETNGTILPSPDLDQYVTRYNVSPKLANSGMPLASRWRQSPLDWFAASEKATFKFVAANPEDASEIEQFQRRFDLSSRRLFVMPEARDRQTLEEHRQQVFALCLRHGWRYSDRLHVAVFGDRRGV